MQLNTTFVGICDFVPVHDSTGLLEKVWVLLVNAQDPNTVPGGKVVNGKVVIFDHWAYVRYPLEHVIAGAPPDSFGLWPLHECDLQILDDLGRPIGGGPVLAAPILSSPHEPMNAAEEEAFHWVGHTGGSDARFTKVRADCIGAPGNVILADVSSRLLIEGGTLSSKLLVKRPANPDPVNIIWGFEPPDPPTYYQALAEEVALNAQVATNSVRLSKTNRRTGEIQELRLTQVGGRVCFSVLNLEPESILGIADPRRSHLIEEYRWFYKLMNDRNAPHPIPVTDPVSGGNPYCPMARSDAP